MYNRDKIWLSVLGNKKDVKNLHVLKLLSRDILKTKFDLWVFFPQTHYEVDLLNTDYENGYQSIIDKMI